MTMDEKLDLLLYKVDRLDEKVSKLEERMTGLEERLTSLEERMTSVEERLTALEERVTEVENELRETKKDVSCVKTDVIDIRVILENEIRTNIQRVAEGHLDLSRNLHTAMKPSNENEMLAVRVGMLETDVKALKQKMA